MSNTQFATADNKCRSSSCLADVSLHTPMSKRKRRYIKKKREKKMLCKCYTVMHSFIIDLAFFFLLLLLLHK